MTDAMQQPSDHALGRRLGGLHGPRTARTMLRVVLVVVAGVAFLPNVAVAHDYENPGFNGARLFVEMYSDGTVPPFSYNQEVKGKDFLADQPVEIFQCPSSAPIDPRMDCVVAGRAQSDAAGSFTAEVVVSGGMPTKDVYCAPIGTSQCHMVAATYAPGKLTEVTSEAEHHLCFGEDFAWLWFPTQYTPRQPYEECAGPPAPTVTTTTTTPPNEWEPAAPMNVARQRLATAVGNDGRIYAMGGNTSGGTALSSAETFNPCGQKSWSPLPPMPTARTQFAAATGPDGRIYAIGGRDALYGTPLATVDAYDPAANVWSTVARLAVPRSDLAAATGSDGRIYAIGGLLGGSGETSTVEAYDTVSDEWQVAAPMSASRWDHGATTGADGRVYAIGGRGAILFESPVAVESYAPGPAGTPGTWTPALSRPNLPPEMEVTTGPDGLIYGTGGVVSANTVAIRTMNIYDPATDTWTPSTERQAMISKRTTHAAAAGLDGRIYAIGGTEDPFTLDDPVVTDGPAPLSSVEALKVAPNSCPPPSTPPADFDGDGDTDVSVLRPSTGTWFAKDGVTTAWGTQGDIPVPADYDGDRITDVAVFRPATGLWAIDGSAGVDTFVTYGIATDVPVPADYDGDGKTDIAVYRPDYATWWVHRSSDGADTATTFGLSTDVPVPGDYDGDGQADLGIFRDGVWFVQPASGGAYTATTYGIGGDVPVPGDYDTDRRTDMAIFRPSDGTWALHHSSDGADEIFGFGIPGDVPVPGDYDGDWRWDPAVFRPSTGQWFIETGETHSWGTATDIPLPLPHAVRRAYVPSSP